MKYTPVFNDLESIFSEIEKEIAQPSFSDNVKLTEKAIRNNQDPPQGQKKQKRNKVREYVDLDQEDHEKLQTLDDLVTRLILKLKQFYYNRKLKPPKGKLKSNIRVVKKRYITGLNEVNKHLKAGNLSMVIIAVDLEKVEEEGGIDDMIV